VTSLRNGRQEVQEPIYNSLKALPQRFHRFLWQLSALYRSADKSLARPGKKKANASVRMAWITFGALPCRKMFLMTARVCMLLKSPRPWHASELVSFLVGLRTYQHPSMWNEVPCIKSFRCFVGQTRQISLRFTVTSLPNLYKHV